MSEHDKQTASTSQQSTSDNLNSHDKIEELHTLTNRLANELERSRIAQYTELLNRPWKLIGLNLLSGAARGVGIAIGFTFSQQRSFTFCSYLGRSIFPLLEITSLILCALSSVSLI